MALVRGAAPTTGFAEFAERAFAVHDGCSVPIVSSERAFETDEATYYDTELSLVRQVVNQRVASIAAAYFDHLCGVRDFVIPFANLQGRKFTALPDPDNMVPFHQDAFGFPPYFKGVINCWTLLSPDECGITSPGLDLVATPPGHFFEKEKSPTSLRYYFAETDHALARDFAQHGGVVTPSVRLGDVLMFNELALHRTSTRGGFDKTRASAEIRLCPAIEPVLGEFRTTGAAYATVSNGEIEWPSRWRLLKSNNQMQPVEQSKATLL